MNEQDLEKLRDKVEGLYDERIQAALALDDYREACEAYEDACEACKEANKA